MLTPDTVLNLFLTAREVTYILSLPGYDPMKSVIRLTALVGYPNEPGANLPSNV